MSQAATTAFKKLSSILEKKPQEKQIEAPSDLVIINALKSYLIKDDSAQKSFGIIAKFIQSSNDEESAFISRLMIKASDIDPQIKSIYTVKESGKQISAAEPTVPQTTLDYKARLHSGLKPAEEKIDDNPGCIPG